MAHSYVLILVPNAAAQFPAIVGGYGSHAEAVKAGEAAMRWPPNVTDEEYEAFHANRVKHGLSSDRPAGQPAAWADFSVIPGAAVTPPAAVARETLKAR